MKFFFFSRIFGFLTVIYTLVSLSLSSTVYTITDLTANDESFECQAKYWTASSQRTTNIYTTCNNTYILGGYNVLGSSIILIGGLLTPTSNGDYYQRIYTGIPDHNLIQFSFNLWAVDNWSTSGKFQVQFDSTLIDGFGLTNSLFPSDFCGSSLYKDFQPVNIYGTVAHNSTTLTLRITHYLGKDSTLASVAFRDITLQFITTSNTTSSSLCGKASITIPTASQCPCPTGQYKNSSGICVNCDSSCASCYGPTSSQCYVCSPLAILNGLKCIICDEACSYCYGTSNSECTACSSGYWMMGNSTCIRSCDAPLVRDVSVSPRTCSSPCNSTAYFAWDGICVANCDSPLKKGGVEGEITVPSCDFPCDATDYLYDNGTCSGVCDSPYVPSLIRGRRFCSYPCSSGQYLFWNSSCENNCDAPLEIVNYSGMQICNYKCSGNEYLYSNGSCLTTCPYPFIVVIESGKYFCNYKCQTSEYLYSNGTCAGTCDPPLIERIVSNQKFCDYPCYPNQYLLDNGTCSNTCDFPLNSKVIADQLYCLYICGSGEYLYWNGTCAGSCDSPLKVKTEGTEKFCEYPCCSSQFLAENGTCLNTCALPMEIRIEGDVQYCDYKCNSGEYLYWNGTCDGSCDSPLVVKTEAGGSQKFCEYPCTDNQFLAINGTCFNACPSPLIIRTEDSLQYCDNICAASGQYLYPNGTCHNSCLSPLVQRTQGTELFCEYPCTSNQYLLDNGTCSNICQAPMTIKIETGGQQYCSYSCISSEFIYENGTCASGCVSAYKIRTESGKQFCDPPCDGEYSYSNGTCAAFCESPFIEALIGGVKSCIKPCAISEFVLPDGSCSSLCDSPMRQQTADYGKTCVGPCDSASEFYDEETKQCEKTCSNKTAILKNNLYLSCSSNETTTEEGEGESLPTCNSEDKKMIVRMAQHVIYYDINYPSSLKSVKPSRGRTFLSPRVNFDMPESIQKSIPKREIPRGFAKGGELHSNFLVNMWDDMMLMIILLTLLGVLVIYEKIATKKNWTQMKAIFGKLVTIFEWNLVIVVFAINIENIILYAALDLMSSDYDDSLALGSLFVSLLMLCVTFAFFVFIFVRVLKSSRTNKVLPQSSAAKMDYRSYYRSRHAGSQVMYCGFRSERSRINKYFYLMYCVRSTLPIILACFFYNYPVPQSVFQMLVSVGVLSFLIWKKPIENQMDNIQLVMIEGLMMLINFCGFLLVILSDNETYESKFANHLGDIILFLSTCVNGLVLIFLTIKITLKVQEILANNQGKDKSAWVSLGAILVQQSAFGFEKMSLDSSPPVKETKTLLPKLTIPNNSTLSARPETTEMPVFTSARTDMDDTIPSVVTISRSGRRYNPTRDKNCASHFLQRKSGVFSPVKGDTLSELESPAKILVDPFGMSFAQEQESPLDSLNGSFSYSSPNRRARRSLLNPRRVATPIEEADDQSPRLFLNSQGSPTQRIKRRSTKLLSNTRMGSPLFSQLDSTRPVLEDDALEAGTSRHLTEMLREKFDIDEVVKPVFTNPLNRTIKTSQSIRMDTVFSTNGGEDKLDIMLASAFQNGVLNVQSENNEVNREKRE